MRDLNISVTMAMLRRMSVRVSSIADSAKHPSNGTAQNKGGEKMNSFNNIGK